LDGQVRPALSLHGGSTSVTGFEAGVLSVRLHGEHAGCLAADLSTQHLVRDEVVGAISEVAEVALVGGVSDDLIARTRAPLRPGPPELDHVTCPSTPQPAGGWRTHYRQRLVTAEEAVTHIKSGDRVVVHHACAEPTALIGALIAGADAYQGVEIVHMRHRHQRHEDPQQHDRLAMEAFREPPIPGTVLLQHVRVGNQITRHGTISLHHANPRLRVR
jgi:Fe-S cluster biogenesis protein NfuA